MIIAPITLATLLAATSAPMSEALTNYIRAHEAEFGTISSERKEQLAAAMVCFSKKYDCPPNPQSGFMAAMTCAQADHSCPIVAGADARISLPYDDPKTFDGTPDEQRKCDERTARIARELIYAFSQATK